MKSFIVLGLGRFGKSLAQTLYDLGYEVLGVDGDEKIVNDFSGRITRTIQADITSEEFLRSIDVGKFDAAVVAVGSNTQVGIMATVLLKELQVKFVLVKAKDDFEEKILYKIGADKVILPEKDMGAKVAHNLVAANFYDMIEISPEYSITTVTAPESWYGKTLGELGARARYGTNILAVKSEGGTNIIPSANTVIEGGSMLIILGTNSDIKRFSNVK